MEQDIQIFVDNVNGNNNHSGNQNAPVRSVERAFSLLPTSWTKRAEIIFVTTGEEYIIQANALYFGTPSGSEASPLLIKGGYKDLLTITAESGSGDTVVTTADVDADDLIGAVLTRASGSGSPAGRAVSIRGNTAGPTPEILLQQKIGSIERGDTFKVQRPAVILRPTRSLHLTSHDGRATNCTLIGIKLALDAGAELALLNVRAHCDTCEFAFQSARALYIQTRVSTAVSRIRVSHPR